MSEEERLVLALFETIEAGATHYKEVMYFVTLHRKQIKNMTLPLNSFLVYMSQGIMDYKPKTQ